MHKAFSTKNNDNNTANNKHKIELGVTFNLSGSSSKVIGHRTPNNNE